jgi:hypothetical protein
MEAHVSLHARIAEALGWSEADVKSFSFYSLREVVRPVSAKLTAELDVVIRSGSYIIGEKRRSPRRTSWRS